MAGNDIDPVPRFEPSDKGKNLVRSKIEWVQREPQLFMTNQRKEAKGAVDRPLDKGAPLSFAYESFDGTRQLAYGINRETGVRQEISIVLPGSFQGFLGVVEQVNVAGNAGLLQKQVQSGSARNIAIALFQPVARDYEKDFALEFCKSHSFNLLAWTYVARSPWRWILSSKEII